MKQQLKLYILLAMIAVACASTRVWAQVNYDESKVKPYTLEDPLRFVNGKKVKNLKDWELRRQEILGIFQKEMYGQMPPKSDIVLLNYCGNHTMMSDEAIFITENLDVPHQLFRELKPRGTFADANQRTYYPSV